MIPIIAVLGYLFGFAIGIIINYLMHGGDMMMLLLGFSFGGLISTVMVAGYWSLLPRAVKNVIDAYRTGILIVAIGADKKARLIPGITDGFVIRPKIKPYKDKYAWAADGESGYPVNAGKGMQAIVTYMGYPYPLEARKAAAISKFREKGFKSLEELKTATELPSLEEVDRRIEELRGFEETVANMDEKDVEKRFGVAKEQVLAEVRAELARLERVRELVEKHGGGASLTVNVDGATVRAQDLISYLVWRHHPAELHRIVKAETNAILSRMNALDWLKQLMPVIIVTGMMVLAILAAIYMLGHGGGAQPAPTRVIPIGG